MSRHMISQAAEIYQGAAHYPRYNAARGVRTTPLYVHSFGAPAVADADGVTASQSLNTGVAATIGGLLASGGVATFDVPRNVVAAWTGTAVITVTGTDQYGETIVESSASGTSLAGKKAFKTVTHATVSANVTGLTIGSGDVLGLPFRVDANGVLAARANNAIDAGTFVAGDGTTATATTGDVRGTFDPAVALNGSNTVQVLIKVSDTSTKVGAFGVAQYGG